MALSKERLGEIAVLVLENKMKKEGMEVVPKELRSKVFNGAKELGISPVELAEFTKFGLAFLFAEANDELDSLMNTVSNWPTQPPKPE